MKCEKHLQHLALKSKQYQQLGIVFQQYVNKNRTSTANQTVVSISIP